MFNKLLLYLKNLDWVLLSAILILICLGILEIYSITLSQDAELLNFKKQALFIAAGIILLFSFSFLDYYNLRSFSYSLYGIGFLALVAVLFFGKTVRGTTGWFDFGWINLQPVEFVKFIFIIFLAKYFSGISLKINPLKHLFISGSACLLLIIPILKQPDFGSAAILFFLWLAMIMAAGFSKKYLLGIGLILIIVFASGWIFFFADYQKQRIITFLDPSSAPLGRGYNITQAIIAIGSGGITGRGIGFGSQSQLKFLPESQNDFIFAVIAEELGFAGACLVIALFTVFFYRLLANLKRVNDDFGVYFIIGTMSLLFIEMFVNIGMNIGLLPVVGISLPFLSYGGSAIVSSLIMVGVAQSIIIRSKLKY